MPNEQEINKEELMERLNTVLSPDTLSLLEKFIKGIVAESGGGTPGGDFVPMSGMDLSKGERMTGNFLLANYNYATETPANGNYLSGFFNSGLTISGLQANNVDNTANDNLNFSISSSIYNKAYATTKDNYQFISNEQDIYDGESRRSERTISRVKTDTGESDSIQIISAYSSFRGAYHTISVRQAGQAGQSIEMDKDGIQLKGLPDLSGNSEVKMLVIDPVTNQIGYGLTMVTPT